MTFRDRGRRQVRFGGGVAFHEHQGEDLAGGVLSNILLSGDFRSTNWNGAIPADLSSAPDPAATAGFYLDSSAGVIQALGFYGVVAEPAGIIKAYGGTTAPTGYLLCNGAAVSRTTYAALFAVIGTTFGVGDGATTFNVPDLRGRFPLGKAAAGTGSTLGGTGGAIDHTHTGPSHAHSGPSHTHTGPSHTHTGPSHTHSGPSHTHGFGGYSYVDATSAGGHTHSGPYHDHSISHTHTFSDTSGGASADTAKGGTGSFAATSSHTHSVSGTTSGSSAANTGNAGSGATSSDGSHSHSHQHGIDGTTGSGGTEYTGYEGTGATGADGTGATGSDGTGSTGSAGTGATGTNNPPFIALNWLIKT